MAWVTTPTNKFRLHFEDYSGIRSSMTFRLLASETDPAAGGAAAIADAAQGMSAAALTSQEIIIEAVQDTPGTPTDGPYCRGADKVLLVFTSENGVPVNLQIGAPNETILAADHENVDPADTALAALVAALQTYGCDADGGDIKVLTRGFRRRPPRRKHK